MNESVFDRNEERPKFLGRFECGQTSRYTFGLIALAMVVLLWVSSSFLIEYILKDYPKPFFMTYFSVFTFQLYFIPILIRQLGRHYKRKFKNNIPTLTEHSSSSTLEPEKISMLSKIETMKLSFYFFIIYFLAAYFANASFGLTDVVSASILLSTSCFFTLLMSVLFQLEKFTWMKGLAVMISAGGVVIVGFIANSHDLDLITNPRPNPLVGNIYAIASAFLYGLYSVILKKVAQDEDRIDMPFFFGLVGLFSAFSLWPFFLIFHYTGFEIWVTPSFRAIGLLILNYLFGTFLSNYCWYLAVLYTSPLVVAIGISLTTPCTLLVDALVLERDILHFRSLAGIFIIIGFLIVNFSSIFPNFNSFFENQYRSCFPKSSR